MEGYHQITLSEWMEQKKQLQRELNNVREGYVRVGYILRKMEESRAYEAEGYKSVAEFAEKEHGLKPSTTSRWMAINREFSLDGYSMQLDPKYLDMNASQLTEMLTLAIEDREMVRPETKREDIRELRRLEKEEPKTESGLEQIVRMFLEENKTLHTEIVSWLMFRPEHRTELIEKVNPSGNRSYRKNGMMLMMYEDYIKYKAAGKKPETVEWSEFFEIAKNIESPNLEEEEWKEVIGDAKSDEEGTDGEAAVENAAKEAGEESPEGSRREVEESRGVDDERRDEVDGGYNGEVGADGSLPESWADGDGDRAGDESGDFGGRGTEGSELSGECGGSEVAGDHQEDRDAIACGSGQDRGIGTAGREGREEDSKPGTDGSGTEEKAEVKGLREADDHCGERKEAAHLPGYAEDSSNQAEKEESRTGSLTDDFPAPEGVEDVENAAAEIAPAQFASETTEDILTTHEYLNLARKAVRKCREVLEWVEYQNGWEEALDIIDEELRPILIQLQSDKDKRHKEE